MEPDRGDKVPEPVEDWEARDKDKEVDADWEEEIRPVREPEETAYVLPVGRLLRIRSGWPVIACPVQNAGRRWFAGSSLAHSFCLTQSRGGRKGLRSGSGMFHFEGEFP